MGLSDAIQEFIEVRLGILSCVKCLTFWVVLTYLILHRMRIVQAVPASFILSYLALWLDLGLSALNKIYNEQYKQIISAEGDDSKKAKPKYRKASKDNPSMPPMRKKK